MVASSASEDGDSKVVAGADDGVDVWGEAGSAWSESVGYVVVVEAVGVDDGAGSAFAGYY